MKVGEFIPLPCGDFIAGGPGTDFLLLVHLKQGGAVSPRIPFEIQCDGTVSFCSGTVIAVKGGWLHCVLWRWPESACWFVRSKY